MRLGDSDYNNRINIDNNDNTNNSGILINPLSNNNIGHYKSNNNNGNDLRQLGHNSHMNVELNYNNGISNDIINIGTISTRVGGNMHANLPPNVIKPGNMYPSGIYQPNAPENNQSTGAIIGTTPSSSSSSYYLPRRLINNSTNIMNPTSFAGAMMNSTVRSAMGREYQPYQPSEPTMVHDPYLFRSQETPDHMHLPNLYGPNPQLQGMQMQVQYPVQQLQQHPNQHPNQQLQQQLEHQQLQQQHQLQQLQQLQHQQPIAKRRVTRACDYCRKRKIRCDPVNPDTQKCNNCFKNDFECTFFFHEELERKKRDAHLKELTPAVENDNNVASNSVNDDDIIEDDILLITELTNSSDPKITKFMKIMNNRIKKIDRKVKVTEDISKNMKPMLDKLVATDGTIFNEYQFVTRMVPRKYTQSLITPLVMKWILRETPTEETPEEYIKPLEDMFDHSIKWYTIQKKRIVNFSSFLNRNNGMNIYPLPDRDTTDILLRCFYESVIHTSLIDHISSIEIFQLSQKYYVSGPSTLSFSERFFVSICIFGGVKFAVFQGVNRTFLPDIEVLKNVGTQMFCNLMLFYNISTEGSSDLLYLKGLLVLSKLCHLMLNSQIAYEILEQARRVALALGLNRDETYHNMAPNMAITKMGIWAYLICRDRTLASDLSKPFLVKNTYLDFSSSNANTAIFDKIISFHSTSSLINGKKSSITEADLQKIMKCSDTRERIDILVSYPEYIPFVLNYHGFHLFELDGVVYEACFYVNTTNNVSFEEKFDEVVDINDRLRIWLESLSPAMRLDSYEEYFILLKLKKKDEGLDHEYEGLCTRVLTSHLHFYSLSLTVAQFALSMIRDNFEASMRSKKDTKKLMIAFETQYLDSAEQILIIFRNFSNVSIRYLEIREYVMSAIFTLILYVIDNQGDKDKFIANALVIKGLQKTFNYMSRFIEEDFVSDSVKFVADLFIFAFLMKSAILSFNNKNSLAGSYNFHPEDYNEIIRRLTELMKKIKENELSIFKSCITSTIRNGSNKILTDITKEFLELLESDEYLLSSSHLTRKPIPNLKDLYDVVSMHPFKWDIDSPVQPDLDGPELRESLFDNDDGFFNHFPYSEFFYDRNFSFDKTLGEMNM